MKIRYEVASRRLLTLEQLNDFNDFLEKSQHDDLLDILALHFGLRSGLEMYRYLSRLPLFGYEKVEKPSIIGDLVRHQETWQIGILIDCFHLGDRILCKVYCVQQLHPEGGYEPIFQAFNIFTCDDSKLSKVAIAQPDGGIDKDLESRLREQLQPLWQKFLPDRFLGILFEIASHAGILTLPQLVTGKSISVASIALDWLESNSSILYEKDKMLEVYKRYLHTQCPFGISSCRCPFDFREKIAKQETTLGESWVLPIKEIKGGVEVVFPIRLNWDKDTATRVEIDEGGSYLYHDQREWQDEYQHSVRDCIQTAWEEVGYAVAEPIPEPVNSTFCVIDVDLSGTDLDEIPF
ncbi:MAG: hypothetical protein F6J93_40085 [Oscillatoria sp. SIO1A7]|nr:hypothetical protein [Oscillatoria sp. SIO1A7]